jgi:hypothetical protein
VRILRLEETTLLAAAGRVVATALSAGGMALPIVVIATQPVSRRLLPAHKLQWRLQPYRPAPSLTAVLTRRHVPQSGARNAALPKDRIVRSRPVWERE